MFPPGAAGASPAYRNRGDTPRVPPEAAAYRRGVKTDDNVNFSAGAPVGPPAAHRAPCDQGKVTVGRGSSITVVFWR